MRNKLIKSLSPSQKKGQKFEAFSENYLKKKGMKLITRNFTCRHGEIDLIMLDQRTLVFIEVRYRNNPNFGSALDSITPSKQKKIIKTAQHYLQTNSWTTNLFCRFDALGIIGDDKAKTSNTSNYQIEWVKNAFTL